jgi:hypothetical protein
LNFYVDRDISESEIGRKTHIHLDTKNISQKLRGLSSALEKRMAFTKKE